MNTNQVLALIETPVDKPLFTVSYSTAVECLLEAIDEYCPTLRTAEITDEEWRRILDAYLDRIMQCKDDAGNRYPQAQERDALLSRVETLQRHGLSDEGIDKLRQGSKPQMEQFQCIPEEELREEARLSITKELRKQFEEYYWLRGERGAAEDMAGKVKHDPLSTEQCQLEELDEEVTDKEAEIFNTAERLMSIPENVEEEEGNHEKSSN